jgi:hypothetical protein
MTKGLLAGVAALGVVVAWGVATGAQERPALQPGDAPNYAFDITKAEIDYVLKNAPPSPPDRQLRVVDMGKYNLGVGIIRRGPTNDKPGDPIPVLWHDYTPEIYYITSGGGVLTTGGVIENRRPDQGVPNVMNGPGGSGTAGRGAYSRRVSAGDIIIVPNKVAHGWSQVTDHVEYLSFRPDPDRALPAGWVYPLLLRNTPNVVQTAAPAGRGAPPAQGTTPAAPPRD